MDPLRSTAFAAVVSHRRALATADARLLHHRAEPVLLGMIGGETPPTARVAHFAPLAHDLRHYLALPVLGAPPDPAHVLALFFQVRRAFHFTLEHILGGSRPAAELRATVWQAIFTRDMRRYRRALHDRMHDVTTLIVGPSGTGKGLVARATRRPALRRGLPRGLLPPQHLGARLDPRRVRALRPQEGRLYRRRG